MSSLSLNNDPLTFFPLYTSPASPSPKKTKKKEISPSSLVAVSPIVVPHTQSTSSSSSRTHGRRHSSSTTTTTTTSSSSPLSVSVNRLLLTDFNRGVFEFDVHTLKCMRNWLFEPGFTLSGPALAHPASRSVIGLQSHTHVLIWSTRNSDLKNVNRAEFAEHGPISSLHVAPSLKSHFVSVFKSGMVATIDLENKIASYSPVQKKLTFLWSTVVNVASNTLVLTLSSNTLPATPSKGKGKSPRSKSGGKREEGLLLSVYQVAVGGSVSHVNSVRLQSPFVSKPNGPLASASLQCEFDSVTLRLSILWNSTTFATYAFKSLDALLSTSKGPLEHLFSHPLSCYDQTHEVCLGVVSGGQLVLTGYPSLSMMEQHQTGSNTLLITVWNSQFGSLLHKEFVSATPTTTSTKKGSTAAFSPFTVGVFRGLKQCVLSCNGTVFLAPVAFASPTLANSLNTEQATQSLLLNTNKVTGKSTSSFVSAVIDFSALPETYAASSKVLTTVSTPPSVDSFLESLSKVRTEKKLYDSLCALFDEFAKSSPHPLQPTAQWHSALPLSHSPSTPLHLSSLPPQFFTAVLNACASRGAGGQGDGAKKENWWLPLSLCLSVRGLSLDAVGSVLVEALDQHHIPTLLQISNTPNLSAEQLVSLLTLVLGESSNVSKAVLTAVSPKSSQKKKKRSTSASSVSGEDALGLALDLLLSHSVSAHFLISPLKALGAADALSLLSYLASWLELYHSATYSTIASTYPLPGGPPSLKCLLVWTSALLDAQMFSFILSLNSREVVDEVKDIIEAIGGEFADLVSLHGKLPSDNSKVLSTQAPYSIQLLQFDGKAAPSTA